MDNKECEFVFGIRLETVITSVNAVKIKVKRT